MTHLGGYDPEAGRSAHRARKPTLIPVPSLLASLLSDHLDPGYQAAADAKQHGNQRTSWQSRAWQIAGAVLIAAVFVAAVAQARSTAPGVRESQHVLSGSVRSVQAQVSDASGRRNALAAQVDTERRQRLEGDARGRLLLGRLDESNLDAAATAVIGPGLEMTITDPGMTEDLTDVSKERVPGSQQVILDRDLQQVVNSLWLSGAEAVSVGGVRIGPNVTIRQAGGGILVDNQPISSPYIILALGPPHSMQDVFERSSGLQRLRLLETSYGVGVNVSTSEALTLPASPVRDVNFAKEIGQ